jgi:hypothetical protein
MIVKKLSTLAILLCFTLLSACGDDSPAQSEATPPNTTGEANGTTGSTSGEPVDTAQTPPIPPDTSGEPDSMAAPDEAPVPTDSTTAVDTQKTTNPDTAAPPMDTAPPMSDTMGSEDTATPPPEAIVRFIAVGDTGEGNPAQYQVADGIAARCAQEPEGCDFGLLLGDNFYDDGVDSPDDNQFETKFQSPYAGLTFPFYITLGNHDLGGAGLNVFQIPHYVSYGVENEKWIFPSEYYEVELDLVHLISLHTNPLAYLGTTVDEQGAMVDQVMASTQATWVFAFGHHPYRSNGKHGNAGSYEGIPGDLVFFGGEFRKFVEKHMCGKVDVYLCGHDHNLQWMSEPPGCDMALGISGAGAKTTSMKDHGNNFDFEMKQLGFAYIEASSTTLYVEFCDDFGELLFSTTLVK